MLSMSPRARRANGALFLLAGISCVAALLVAQGTTGQVMGHLLASAFWFLSAAAFGWAGWDRARREGGRKPWFVLLTAGGVLWLVGQGVRYAVLWDATTTDATTASLPWLLGLPLGLAGLIGMAWPTGMERQDLLHLIVDSMLGIGSLAVIWSLVVVPQWGMTGGPDGVAARMGRWALFVGLSVLIVFIVSSRRLGALPLTQLLLLLGGLAVVLISATVRELIVDDEPTTVTYTLLGYWVGICLIGAMLQRSPAEAETEHQNATRAVVAFLAPFALVMIAGVVVIRLAAQSRPDSTLLAVAPILWIVVLSAIAVASTMSLLRLRDHRREGLSSQLTMSAERGWVSALLRDSSEYVFVLDPRGIIVYSAPRSQATLGQAASLHQLIVEPFHPDLDTLLSGIIADALPPGPYEMGLRAADGSRRSVEVHLRPVKEVAFEGFVVTGIDVTDSRTLAARLESTVTHDPLTGLLSAEAFSAELGEALQICPSSGNGLAVAMLDLTDFGVWNESLGRDVGDTILKAVASALEALPDAVRTVARIGGDSFGLLVQDRAPRKAMETSLDALEQRLRGLILASDSEIDIGFRVGFTVMSPRTKSLPTAAQLLEQADIALRRVRHSRHARTVQFRAGMNEDLVRRLAAEGLVREALSNDGLIAHYQPIVSLANGHVTAVEVLARVRTSNGELIGPDDFIEAADYAGLIGKLDHRIRELAAQDLPLLAAATHPDLRININVAEVELTAHLAHELRELGITEHVTIEVTEASVLSNLEAAQVALQNIRRSGGLVAIDDFGTGYSSLSQIASLPCDVMKIDRSFVAGMLQSPKTMSLVRAMIQLSHDLGLLTVAEGVEDADQAAALRALGCDRAQGFYYSQPLALPDVLDWLTHTAADRAVLPPQGAR